MGQFHSSKLIKTIVYIGLSVAALVGFLSGCNRPDMISPSINPVKNWESRLGSEYVLYSSFRPIVTGSTLIGSRSNISINSQDVIVAFDAHNGQVLWEWNEQLHSPETFTSNNYIFAYSNILAVASSNSSVYAIDIDSGTTLWSCHEGDLEFGRDITGSRDTIFNVAKTDSSVGIYKSSIYQGNWAEVYSLSGNGEWKPRIYEPTIVESPDNGRLALFWVIWQNTLTQEPDPRFCIYNLTEDKLQSSTKLAQVGDLNAGVREKPTANGKSAFLVLDDELICIELSTGDISWRNKFSSSTLGGNTLAVQNYIVASSLDGNMTCFNSNSGEKIWSTFVGGGSEIAESNGILYSVGFSNHHLYAIDLQTGKYLWDYESPLSEEIQGAFFQYFLCVNSSLNSLFISDYFNMYCYELLEN